MPIAYCLSRAVALDMRISLTVRLDSSAWYGASQASDALPFVASAHRAGGSQGQNIAYPSDSTMESGLTSKILTPSG